MNAFKFRNISGDKKHFQRTLIENLQSFHSMHIIALNAVQPKNFSNMHLHLACKVFMGFTTFWSYGVFRSDLANIVLSGL
jgi:hypothetical protein